MAGSTSLDHLSLIFKIREGGARTGWPSVSEGVQGLVGSGSLEADGAESQLPERQKDRREGAAPGSFGKRLRASVLQLLPPPAPTHHPTVIVPAPPPPSHHINVVTMGPSSVINSVSTSRQNLDTIVQVCGLGDGASCGNGPFVSIPASPFLCLWWKVALEKV